MTTPAPGTTDSPDGWRLLLGRLGEFFHIFDLSYFVAGVVSVAALAFLITELGHQPMVSIPGWIVVMAVIVACYVCGLLSFTIGRGISERAFRRSILKTTLPNAVAYHNLRGRDGNGPTLAGDEDLRRLYGLYWQELIVRAPGSVAFSHLMRHWAMAATYDGLAAALLGWAVVIGVLEVSGASSLSRPEAIGLGLFLLGLVVVSLVQGKKHFEVQVEDLAASIATLRQREKA